MTHCTFLGVPLVKHDIVVYLYKTISSGVYKFVGEVKGFTEDRVIIQQLSAAIMVEYQFPLKMLSVFYLVTALLKLVMEPISALDADTLLTHMTLFVVIADNY